MDVELDIAAAIDSISDTVDQLTGKKPLRVKKTRMYFVKAPSFSPEQIVTIRKKYKWTQEDFASALNVPRATVASWETGRKKPSGASFRLLEIFQNEPKNPAPSRKRATGFVCALCGKSVRSKDSGKLRQSARRESKTGQRQLTTPVFLQLDRAS
jgi:DNA-binding transcriptional regulator YiaG